MSTKTQAEGWTQYRGALGVGVGVFHRIDFVFIRNVFA